MPTLSARPAPSPTCGSRVATRTFAGRRPARQREQHSGSEYESESSDADDDGGYWRPHDAEGKPRRRRRTYDSEGEDEGSTDGKLWVGAHGEGWRVHAKGGAHYVYVSAAGERFGKRRDAHAYAYVHATCICTCACHAHLDVYVSAAGERFGNRRDALLAGGHVGGKGEDRRKSVAQRGASLSSSEKREATAGTAPLLDARGDRNEDAAPRRARAAAALGGSGYDEGGSDAEAAIGSGRREGAPGCKPSKVSKVSKPSKPSKPSKAKAADAGKRCEVRDAAAWVEDRWRPRGAAPVPADPAPVYARAGVRQGDLDGGELAPHVRDVPAVLSHGLPGARTWRHAGGAVVVPCMQAAPTATPARGHAASSQAQFRRDAAQPLRQVRCRVDGVAVRGL